MFNWRQRLWSAQKLIEPSDFESDGLTEIDAKFGGNLMHAVIELYYIW
jgi:hypothetical protein